MDNELRSRFRKCCDNPCIQQGEDLANCVDVFWCSNCGKETRGLDFNVAVKHWNSKDASSVEGVNPMARIQVRENYYLKDDAYFDVLTISYEPTTTQDVLRYKSSFKFNKWKEVMIPRPYNIRTVIQRLRELADAIESDLAVRAK